MAPMYKTPGVYIEEISMGGGSMEAVSTSTVGFIGTAPATNARVNEAVPITSWPDFCRNFVPEGAKSTPLSNAVFGFYTNVKGLCYVVNIGQTDNLVGKPGKRTGLQCLEPLDCPIIVANGFTSVESYEALLSHCEKMENRMVILDSEREVTDIQRLTKVGTITTKTNAADKESLRKESDGVRPRKSAFGVFYCGEILAMDPLEGKVVNMHPSGHIAGMWARTDTKIGCHRAPAGVDFPLRGALGLVHLVTQEEQDILNPASVNCLRYFPDQGNLVWGARTLADPSNEYRYVNVRRLVIMINQTIQKNTRWIVFQPNVKALWKAIIRDVSDFLRGLWRRGMLAGSTEEEAFMVKCDEDLNTPAEIKNGNLIIEVGVCPSKPAEFVIFRIYQKTKDD